MLSGKPNPARRLICLGEGSGFPSYPYFTQEVKKMKNQKEGKNIQVLEYGGISLEEPNFCGLCGGFCSPVVIKP